MKYSEDGLQVSNTEFALMEIILERGEISGYDIDLLIEERGFRNWADIGTTSIYVGLEKLKKKGLAEDRIDFEKKGRGPLPRLYRLTDNGIHSLRENVREALSSPWSRHSRFDLALAGILALSPSEQLDAVTSRHESLSANYREVDQKYQSQGGENLPLPARLLFEHSFSSMKKEIEFLARLIETLKNGGRNE